MNSTEIAMTTTELAYRITHSTGLTEPRYASYEAAIDALRSVYGDEIETEGDPEDPHGRILVWRDAASAEDDDGVRAVAQIKPVLLTEEEA